jgi:hypothetical protein
MSAYILKTFNHVLAIQEWCAACQGSASIDAMTFELEIKARNRYYKLFPQFWQRANGIPSHLPHITPTTDGFIGWLPYQPLRFQKLQDKRYFKQLLATQQLRTPVTWPSPNEATTDYIFKSTQGSFGTQLSRPYARGTLPAEIPTFPSGATPSPIFTEQFVTGKILKVWFWGGEAFHAHMHERPVISGDGTHTLEYLIDQQLHTINQTWANYAEADFVRQCLAYQDIESTSVLSKDQSVWLDYRYGRRFRGSEWTVEADNALPKLSASVQAQIAQVGELLTREVKMEYDLPISFAVDGVLDDQGQVWWLEVNSNPMFPPTGYPKMLRTLFGF